MGLDISHGCWHGAYSAFMRWREKISQVAGLPPLALMEGFYEPLDNHTLNLPTLYHGVDNSQDRCLKNLDINCSFRKLRGFNPVDRNA